MDYILKDFGKILKKNSLNMRRLLLQENTDCMRVYDRNIDQLPVSVDLYSKYARITDYSEDGLTDEVEELVVDTVRRMCYIQGENVVYHRREKLVDKEQHDIQSNKSVTLEVREASHLFKVDLTKRIDTGLFLDHYKTRKLVQSISDGLRVLNLFSYTGSFSVYAAAGNASLVESVDLSKTYTQWAKHNLSINGFEGDKYPCLNEDALKYIIDSVRQKRKYDLVIFDPPSFSNSRKMEEDFDVQRDYVRYLKFINNLLDKGGKVIFSTNLSSFHMDPGRLTSFDVKNITKDILADGFTSKKGTSRTWILEKKRRVKLTKQDFEGKKYFTGKEIEKIERKIKMDKIQEKETNKLDSVVEETNKVDVVAEEANTVDVAVEETNTVDTVVEDTNKVDELVQETNSIDNIIAEVNNVDKIISDLEVNYEDRAFAETEDPSEDTQRDYSPNDLVIRWDDNKVAASTPAKPDFNRSRNYSRDDRGSRPSRDSRGGGYSRDNRDSRSSFDRIDKSFTRGDGDRQPSRDSRGGSFNRDDRDRRPSRDSRSSGERSFNRDDRDSRPSRDGRFSRDDRGGRPSRDNRDRSFNRDDRESRPSRDSRFSRDDRGGRPSRDNRDRSFNRDDRDSRPSRDSRFSRDDRGGRPSRDNRPSGDRSFNRDDRDSRPSRDSRFSRDDRGGRPSRDNRDRSFNRDDRDSRPSRDRSFNRDDRDSRPSRDSRFSRDDRGGRPSRDSRPSGDRSFNRDDRDSRPSRDSRGGNFNRGDRDSRPSGDRNFSRDGGERKPFRDGGDRNFSRDRFSSSDSPESRPKRVKKSKPVPYGFEKKNKQRDDDRY